MAATHGETKATVFTGITIPPTAQGPPSLLKTAESPPSPSGPVTVTVYTPAGAQATVKDADSVAPRPSSVQTGFEIRPFGEEEIMQLPSPKTYALIATIVPAAPEIGDIVIGGLAIALAVNDEMIVTANTIPSSFMKRMTYPHTTRSVVYRPGTILRLRSVSFT
jgi:hypothetical protein